MKWWDWNFVFNFISMLASIGTAGTFIILLKERRSKRKENERKRANALRDLKKCDNNLDDVLNLLANRNKIEMFKGKCTISKEEIDNLLSELAIVAGYKVIDDEIRSALYQYINKVHVIYLSVNNNMLTERQSLEIDHNLHEIKEYINLAINNL